MTCLKAPPRLIRICTTHIEKIHGFFSVKLSSKDKHKNRWVAWKEGLSEKIKTRKKGVKFKNFFLPGAAAILNTQFM